MKLRDRLLLFSTAQLLVFGVVFIVGYEAFQLRVLPMFEGLLRAKSERVARTASTDFDVALGSNDLVMIGRAVDAVAADPDLAYLAVRDANDRVVVARGTPPDEALFSGAAYVYHASAQHGQTWSPVALEGATLGRVVFVFSTERFDALARWAWRLAIGALVLWLGTLARSLWFARSFVLPIRAMMEFSRRVAGGALAERLTVPATGELRQLRDYLNQMTTDLEAREAARKLSAARAEAMQRELLVVSRMAGMAEIATGVLHNVGNVLNSLNISVSLVTETVRGSRVAGLTRAVELVDSFPGGLPAFLATDGGKVLPSYLSSVAKRLTADNAAMLAELASVTKNVDHIKAIVATQQSYAVAPQLKEAFSLGTVIDDALRMGELSFSRHGVEVIKDYGPAVTVVTDRHKLLQILINLISNARHAMKEHAPARPQLTVRARATSTHVTITVADTGVGIAPEILGKIFQHGFTTKRAGHGFGLHASANTAQELGGALWAASDGPGQGATFTLELPAPPQESEHRCA